VKLWPPSVDRATMIEFLLLVLPAIANSRHAM
jgi:hypothetical protein